MVRTVLRRLRALDQWLSPSFVLGASLLVIWAGFIALAFMH